MPFILDHSFRSVTNTLTRIIQRLYKIGSIMYSMEVFSDLPLWNTMDGCWSIRIINPNKIGI